MANIVNLVFMPCKLGPDLTATDQPNSGASFRTIHPQPIITVSSGSGGTALPTGPQWWPITG